MKLAFDKKKLGRREISNFTLEDKVWLDIRRYAKTIRKGGAKWIGLCLITQVYLGPLFDMSYKTETSELTNILSKPTAPKIISRGEYFY